MSETGVMNGIFAIEKPPGLSSAQFIAKVQRIFTNSSNFSKELAEARGRKAEQIQKETGRRASRRNLRKLQKVKIGHGGTLDPLASGVLVIGIGKGTKQLSNYLGSSTKVYQAKGLFGASTITGDSEGEVLSRNGTNHLTKELLEETSRKFVGHLKQTPPIFAALKMNGKPLYEYARENIPLPKPIEPREVEVYNLEILDDSLSKEHEFKLIKSNENEDGKLEDQLLNNPTLNDDKLYFSKEYAQSQGKAEDSFEVGLPLKAEEEEKSESFKAPLLHFTATVSSGTYIRSLISDIGKSLRSSAYMVELIRARQAEWELNKNVFRIEDFEERDEAVWGDVLEQVLRDGGKKIQDLSKLFEEAEERHKVHKEPEEETEKVVTEEVVSESGENSKKRLYDEIEQ